jgi:hypothetical protein
MGSIVKNILLIFFVFTLLISAQSFSPKDVKICEAKFKLADEKKLSKEPFGDIIAQVGKSFIGTKYEAHSLDRDTNEALVVNLSYLDCTTYIEYVLAISRCIKEGKNTFDDFKNELTKIRYRDGKINGFLSRLNYFSDWIYDNEKKGIIKNISEEINGVPIKFDIDFMSSHPDLYYQLKKNPDIVSRIMNQEEEISKRKYFYVPKNKISEVERKIQNGDLIAFTSDIKGLDINHTGIAVKMKDGRIHLMHAPDVGQKVQITREPLTEYISKIKKDSGIIVLKPITP